MKYALLKRKNKRTKIRKKLLKICFRCDINIEDKNEFQLFGNSEQLKNLNILPTLAKR